MTVFVTGATAGFGLAIAKKFAADGAKIVGTGRREARLLELKKELGDPVSGFEVRRRETGRDRKGNCGNSG